ncbi:hypothetical protein HY345_00205 [Candidatus Microgenomates bacterium]|nr:hypothetical protein [Candidatus Microgenomates bacterium]
MVENVNIPVTKERLSVAPRILFVDLDETMLRRNNQTLAEVKRVVKTLDKWCEFNNILPIVVTQKPGDFFKKGSKIKDSRKYQEFLKLKWHIDGKNIKMPFVLCEMGCYALMTGKKNGQEHELINNPLFENFTNTDGGEESPRQRLIDMLQNKFVTPGYGVFEEGRLAGVSIIVSPKGVEQKGGGNIALAKAKIKEESVATEEWPGIEPFINILIDGNDVDYELRLVAEKGKGVGVELVEFLLENQESLKNDPRLEKIRDLVRRQKGRAFGIVDDKAYAAKVAAIQFILNGGFAATQTEADEELKAAITEAGGTVSPTRRMLGALAGLGSELLRLRENEILQSTVEFKSRLAQLVDKDNKYKPKIVALGDSERGQEMFEDVIKGTHIRVDKIAFGDFEIEKDYLNMLITTMSVRPTKFLNAIFFVRIENAHQEQLVADFFQKMDRVYRKRNIQPNISLVVFGPSLEKDRVSLISTKVPEYLRQSNILSKTDSGDPRYTNWAYRDSSEKKQVLDQVARTIEAHLMSLRQRGVVTI